MYVFELSDGVDEVGKEVEEEAQTIDLYRVGEC